MNKQTAEGRKSEKKKRKLGEATVWKEKVRREPEGAHKLRGGTEGQRASTQTWRRARVEGCANTTATDQHRHRCTGIRPVHGTEIKTRVHKHTYQKTRSGEEVREGKKSPEKKGVRNTHLQLKRKKCEGCGRKQEDETHRMSMSLL